MCCTYFCRAEPEPCSASGTQSPGLSQDYRQDHLPGNLSCSDYTKYPVSLWAILPFCSVKYKKYSGEGLGAVWLTSLPRLNSLNQEPGLSFAQDVTLDWRDGIQRDRGGEGGGGRMLKKRKQVRNRITESPLCFNPHSFCFVVLWVAPPGLKQPSVRSARPARSRSENFSMLSHQSVQTVSGS